MVFPLVQCRSETAWQDELAVRRGQLNDWASLRYCLCMRNRDLTGSRLRIYSPGSIDRSLTFVAPQSSFLPVLKWMNFSQFSTGCKFDSHIHSSPSPNGRTFARGTQKTAARANPPTGVGCHGQKFDRFILTARRRRCRTCSPC